MGYEHIIAAREKLRALGVPHYDLGGMIGGAGGASMVLGPAAMLPGAVIGSGGNGLMGGLGAVGHAAQNIVPTNNYQAQTPGYATTDFAPMMGTSAFDYKNSQAGLGDEFSDLRATAGSQVDTARGIGTEANAVSGLAGPQGLGGVLGQQQTLGQALLAQSQGQGPNPAQDQYRKNLNQAIAENSAMIAGQKGINPALAARMAGENAATTTQGAAADEAQLQAQQQLAAQAALGQNLTQQGQTVLGQGQLHTTAGGLLGQQVGAEGAAGQTMGEAGQLAGTMGSLANGMYGTSVAGQNGQNNTGVNASLGAQGINAGVSNQNTQVKGQLLGGLLNGAGGVAAAALAGGGEAGVDGHAMSLAQALMARGGPVPGRPRHPGDDPRNDVVPAALSKGEVVLPNSVTQAPDAPEKAARFLAAIKERDASAKKEPANYGHVVAKVRAIRQHMAELEKNLGRAS